MTMINDIKNKHKNFQMTRSMSRPANKRNNAL